MSEMTSSNWSETDASNNAAPPNGWPEGMNPSDVNNSARATMGALKRWFNRVSVTLTLGGGTTNYTATPTVALAAYADEIWTWIMPSANAAAATLNISGLGARNIQYMTGGTWTDVPAGYMPSGAYIAAKYDTATSKFRIIWNSAVGLPASGGTITGNLAVTGTLDVGGTVTQTSTDAGATLGPIHDLYRDSATPAAFDETGSYRWSFEDSGGNKTTGSEIVGKLIDPTNGSEDHNIIFRTMFAGGLGQELEIGGGAAFGAVSGGVKGYGTANVEDLYRKGIIQRPASYVTTLTASASASLVFTAFVAGMDYLFRFNNIAPATDDATFRARVSLDSGSSYRSTAGDYHYGGRDNTDAGTSNLITSGSATFAAVSGVTASGGIGNSTNEKLSGWMELYAPDLGNTVFMQAFTSWLSPTTNLFNGTVGSRFKGTTGAVNGIQFLMSSGNIASGTIDVWSIPRS